MKTLEGVIILILLGILYKIIPEEAIYNFPFSERISTWQFVCFAVILRLMVAYFAFELARCKQGYEQYFLRCFSGLTFAKSIDFVLCGNDEYFGVSYLTFNTVSTFIFVGYEILKEWTLPSSRELY